MVTQQPETAHHVVYAGRLVKPHEPPHGTVAMDAWDVLPHELNSRLKCAKSLTILDPLSFPFETLTASQWDLPLCVDIGPGHFGAVELVAVLGGPLFENLTFYDRVASADGEVWRELRRQYGWAVGQRLPPRSDWRTWTEEVDQSLAMRSGDVTKAVHRAQLRAIEPVFLSANGASNAAGPMSVLELGCGAGRLSGWLAGKEMTYVGVDSPEMVAVASNNFPGTEFHESTGSPDLEFRSEMFDLVIGVGYLASRPLEMRGHVLGEAIRVLRPGGRLAILEDFVKTEAFDDATPLSATQLERELQEASGGGLALDHVEAIRYPGEDLHRAGLIACSKIANPTAL